MSTTIVLRRGRRGYITNDRGGSSDADDENLANLESLRMLGDLPEPELL